MELIIRSPLKLLTSCIAPGTRKPSFRSARSDRSPADHGSVTVFLALSFVMVAALVLTIVESARSTAQRLYMQTALDSSMESLFSQFHRTLWEDYRIFGLEYRTEADLRTELCDFMTPYLEAKNLFPARVQAENLQFSEKAALTEDIYFEEDVLEYMLYGAIDSVLHYAGKEADTQNLGTELSSIFKQSEESAELIALQKEYQLDSRELTAVEKAISAIASRCESIRSLHESAGIALSLEDAGSFYSTKARFCQELDKLTEDVQDYSRKADLLAEKVAALRADFQQRSGALSDLGREAVDAELQEYESYVSESGSVRSQLEAMPAQAASAASAADQLENEVEEFEEWLAEAIEEAEEDDDEDDYDFSAEISRFYRGARSDWNGIDFPRFTGSTSQINEKNKRILESVRELVNGNLLKLLLPDGAVLPAKTALYSSPSFAADSSANPIETLLLGEYALKFFHHYHQNDQAEGALPPSESTALELEYLLAGKSSDYDNLSTVLEKLLVLREASNLLFLYTNAEKRQEARAFVTAALCVTANPVLISVFTFFVLGIWALGQAIADVRLLLQDGRVPLLHTNDSWTMDLSGLLNLGKGQGIDMGDSKGSGLSYRDYLRAFLYGEGLLHQSVINTRMLTAIEGCINRGGTQTAGSFSIDHCLYALGTELTSESRHIMYEQGIVQLAAGGAPESGYSFLANSYYKYRSKTQ